MNIPPRNKPIRRDEYKRLGFHRVVDKGALTPRLRDPEVGNSHVSAIGFYSDIANAWDNPTEDKEK